MISQININDIRSSMGIDYKQKILLSFAWISAGEKNILSKFPEVAFFDVTEKTNKEKRSIFIGTGIDGQGKLFISVHCFMPNAKAISFDWIYKHALKQIVGGRHY